VASSTSTQRKIFLIYIPCHVDYERARENALKIRNQFAEIQDSRVGRAFDLRIIISVNGINLSPEHLTHLTNSADELIYFPESLGADININQGFLQALKIEPDYFWILSANEFLVKGSFNFLLEVILENDGSDLYVTNSKKRSATYETSNVFTDIPDGSGYGLISSVIYNYKSTHRFYSAGPRFAWTGWGQLAVLQTACNALGKISVTEFPYELVYEKPFTDVGNNPVETEFEFVRGAYAHSFFGMAILIFAIFPRDKNMRDRILFAWLRKNWFRISYFNLGVSRKFDANYPQFDPIWIRKISIAILLFSGFLPFLLTCLGSLRNIEKLRKIPAAVSIKKNVYRK
jgi:hypothetical protein